MNTFGTALQKRREEMQLTLREVAGKTKLSPQTVHRAEQGKFVRLEVALKLMDAVKLKGESSTKVLMSWVKDEVARHKKRTRN
jgi:hypothetical protein